MQHIGIRRNLVVPNVSWGITDKSKREGGDGALHECDLLYLTPQGLATEVEIKIEKGDLKREKEKKHTHEHRYISRLYYAVPEELKFIAEELVPARAGILIVSSDRHSDKYDVKMLRDSKINTEAHKWTEAERHALARLGAMRILGLKQAIIKLKNKL